MGSGDSDIPFYTPRSICTSLPTGDEVFERKYGVRQGPELQKRPRIETKGYRKLAVCMTKSPPPLQMGPCIMQFQFLIPDPKMKFLSKMGQVAQVHPGIREVALEEKAVLPLKALLVWG